MEEKKVFPVFSVDVCLVSYAMDQVLIGAESVDDLIKNLSTVIDIDKRVVKKVSNEKDWRISKISNLYTDKPYTLLDRYTYYE